MSALSHGQGSEEPEKLLWAFECTQDYEFQPDLEPGSTWCLHTASRAASKGDLKSPIDPDTNIIKLCFEWKELNGHSTNMVHTSKSPAT